MNCLIKLIMYVVFTMTLAWIVGVTSFIGLVTSVVWVPLCLVWLGIMVLAGLTSIICILNTTIKRTKPTD